MLRTITTRLTCLLTVVGISALGAVTTSCGGGGGIAAKPMSLVEFLIVDRALAPAAPTGSTNVPRNVQLLMVFSELVNPDTVNFQTIQVRTGSTFADVPGGSFRTSGNRVIYDPTLDANGVPRPFGLSPLTQFSVDIPGVDEGGAGVVENLDFDPNLSTFFTTFTTSEGFLRELTPPQIEEIFFIPELSRETGVPGNAFLALRFSEPMDPSSFIFGPVAGPDPLTGLDVRYTPLAAANVAAGVAGLPISGSVDHDAGATTYFFRPTFSFGDRKLEFTVEVFQQLKDLSGNLLLNPTSYGPFTGDGKGLATGLVLREDFTLTNDQDVIASDADWGSATPGVLQGQPITTRDVLIYGADFDAGEDYSGSNTPGFTTQTVTGGRGQYVALDSPLNGAARNAFAPAPVPSTAIGRRVMLAYSDLELGPAGSLTTFAWGPDSNATFAASYAGIILRCGYQKNASLSLGANFEGNWQGAPTVVYQGNYEVSQAINIGNHPGTGGGGTTATSAVNPCTLTWNTPLYATTGFFEWPEPATFFEWDPGTITENDRILVWDMNVPEGDTFQQFRAWWGVKYPCAGFVLGIGSFIGGFPTRYMTAGFEETTPNPPENLGGGTNNATKNPDHLVVDTLFTVTRRVSLAQSLFYGPPAPLPGDPGFNPNFPPSALGGLTFGNNTDYLPPILVPNVQAGGAEVVVEFQAAVLVEENRRVINLAQAWVDWTRDADDCDNFAFIRWRATLISNLISGKVAKLDSLAIPMINAAP